MIFAAFVHNFLATIIFLTCCKGKKSKFKKSSASRLMLNRLLKEKFQKFKLFKFIKP